MEIFILKYSYIIYRFSYQQIAFISSQCQVFVSDFSIEDLMLMNVIYSRWFALYTTNTITLYIALCTVSSSVVYSWAHLWTVVKPRIMWRPTISLLLHELSLIEPAVIILCNLNLIKQTFFESSNIMLFCS